MKEIESYGLAFGEWEKTKIGEAPKMPPLPHFTPFQAATNLIRQAVLNSLKVGNSGNLRHIIRVINDIDAQIKPEATQ